MSFTSRISPFLKARFYLVCAALLIRLRMSGIATGRGLKRQAFLAFLVSKAVDKNRVRNQLFSESKEVLAHLAKNIFLISRKSICEIDFLDQDFLIKLRKNNIDYQLIMSVVRSATGLPFMHDLTPLTEIFFEEAYDRYDYKDGVVIDVGGYIGDSAVYFAKNGAREVYVYEPNPVNFTYLVKNIGLNNEVARTELFEKAISRERSTLRVPDMAGAGGVFSKHGLATYEVGIIHPGQLLKDRGHIALLKVDCKGCELELFSTALEEISQKVSYIIADTGRLSTQERSTLTKNLQNAGFLLESDRDSLLYLRNLHSES